MLLYYQSWMFYNHFVVILYHFLVLTYWHSAKCQLLFSARFYIAGNQYQMDSKCNKTSRRFLWTRRHPMGQGSAWGAPSGAQPTRARQEAQARPGGLCSPWSSPKVRSYPTGCLLAQKIHKKFRCVWTLFGIDFLRCKKHAENNNWHLAQCQ